MLPKLMRCKKNNKPGYKACDSCYCYTYTPNYKRSRENAKSKANQQLIAIVMSEKRAKKRK